MDAMILNESNLAEVNVKHASVWVCTHAAHRCDWPEGVRTADLFRLKDRQADQDEES